MKTTLLTSVLLVALLAVACSTAPPSDLEAELASSRATTTAQAAKVEALTDLLGEMQSTRNAQEVAAASALATVTAAASEREGAQLRAADAEATGAALATQVADLQAEILRLMAELATATALPQATAPSPATATPAPTEDTRAQEMLSQAQDLLDNKEWETAAAKLVELRALDAAYEAEAVTKMLFQAYYNLGLEQVAAGEIEEAAGSFDQALQVQPNDPDALEQRRLASLYEAGVKAAGKDWAEAVKRLGTLYGEAPGYADVAARLLAARVAYGDALVEAESWCQAQDQFAGAMELEESDDLKAKWQAAEKKCTAATKPGVYVGEFTGYEDITKITTTWAAVRGSVSNMAGKPMIGITVQLQAFDWSARATTDGVGKYAFDFLTNELTFTVSLVDLESEPAEARTKFGQAAIVDFAETP